LLALRRRAETSGFLGFRRTAGGPHSRPRHESSHRAAGITRRVCAAIPSGSGASGAPGPVGIWPVTKTKPPASTAREKGATGRGAPAIMNRSIM
jgi:hypothetical protein